MTTFLRVVEAPDKRPALLALVREQGPAKWLFRADVERFQLVPGSPFVYWAGAKVLRLFQDLQPFEGIDRTARVGLQTSDDFRFLRSWYAVFASPQNGRWFPFAKGGSFAPFYGEPRLIVNWCHDGHELKAFAETTAGTSHWSRNLRSTECYLRPAISWPYRPQTTGSFAAVSAGSVFSVNGPMAFVPGHLSWTWLAILNGRIFNWLAQLVMARGHSGSGQTLTYEVGVIQRTPVPDLTPADEEALAKLARRAWSLKRSLDTKTETSHAFVLPALLQVLGDTLAARASAWATRVRETEDELSTIQAEIDERCFELYGISEEDRRSITEGFGSSPVVAEEGADEADAEADEEEEAEAEAADMVTLAAELVSWAVGVAFGRFDVRLATGERELPGEPEPFDPLPVCSPAMLTGADGLPLDSPPAGYPLSFPTDGVLVDDPGHTRDLTAAVRAVFEVVFGGRADALWQEAGDLLDARGREVSNWLRAGVFEHHLRRHSKSRRKAPIVWQLGVPSGRYSIWTYAHRLTRDSMFAIGKDIAAPHLAHEERRLASFRTAAGDSPSARERAEIDAAETAVDEARTFLAEIRRVAPLWDPDLDDGIVLVSAPLWRLVPGHRPWQKELRSRWDDLAAGKYDWAHIAMHLWPEHVVPKCASDRSLAIAHHLEDVFWVEGSDGKWVKRSAPTRPIQDLIAERSSTAVRAALADLQAVPAPAGGGRGRGRN